MEEAQELSDHIAVMDRGEIIAFGTHQELVQIVGELDRIDLSLSMPPGRESKRADLIQQWRSLDGVHKVSANSHGTAEAEAGAPGDASAGIQAASEDGGLTLLVDDSNLVLPDLFEKAVESGARITSVDIQEPNLEAVFLHLTGRALRD
jgi:ABC-2 type transport system ATP-binding protein